MKIECQLDVTLVVTPKGSANGLELTCGDCDHCVSLPGRDTPQLREKLVDELRRTCPQRENNHYEIVE